MASQERKPRPAWTSPVLSARNSSGDDGFGEDEDEDGEDEDDELVDGMTPAQVQAQIEQAMLDELRQQPAERRGEE